MADNFKDPLPGVPRVESPFFDHFFSAGLTDDETFGIAQDLNRDGFAVFTFPEPDFDAVAERLKAALHDKYDWDGWRSGRLANLRLQDTWVINDDSYRIATNKPVLDLLERLYGREPFPFQSLNFPIGTEQHYHSDSTHFSCMPERFMCGVWVALEDIGPDQGPLIYYPGSHKWPIYAGEHIQHSFGKSLGTNQSAYERLWEDLVAVNGVKPRRFHAKKGQALIWAANLLHGGDLQTNKEKTRWSQVTHYYFKDCCYYTPMHSDTAVGLVSYRQPFNILTRGIETNHYNGMRVPDTVLVNASPFSPNQSWITSLPADFDAQAYGEINPDVIAAGLTAGDHYLKHGRAEGRRYKR